MGRDSTWLSRTTSQEIRSAFTGVAHQQRGVRLDAHVGKRGQYQRHHLVGLARSLQNLEERPPALAFGKTQGQRLTQAWFGGLGAAMVSEEALTAEVQRMIADGEVDDETRKEIRRALREGIEEQMRKQGQSPRQNRAIVDSLTRQVEHLMIDEKKTEAEITEMFRKGEIRP